MRNVRCWREESSEDETCEDVVEGVVGGGWGGGLGAEGMLPCWRKQPSGPELGVDGRMDG